MVYSKRPIRRAQILSPWGIGAIVPFPNDESLMIAGLDFWHYDDEDVERYRVIDKRLTQRLGVKELRLPPDFNGKSLLSIPAVRFPLWHYCPYCGSMIKAPPYLDSRDKCDAYPWTKGRSCSNKTPLSRRRTLVPERFIVICEDGHIDDFPLMEWVHRNGPKRKSDCKLRRSTGGISTSLAGVRYTCTCGASSSLLGATKKGVLDNIGYTCKGLKPWLGYENEKCGKSVKVVQRGGSNVWFPDIRSSITIPYYEQEVDKRVVKVVDDYYEKLKKSIEDSRVNGEIDLSTIEIIAEVKKVDAKDLYKTLLSRINGENEFGENLAGITEEEFRLDEYKKLISTFGNENLDLHTVNFPISKYNSAIQDYFESITLVKKLRETRAFLGFSRVQPDSGTNFTDKKNMLSNEEVSWLPAIVVYGEGLFFQFNKEKLMGWMQQKSVQDRIARLDDNYHRYNIKMSRKAIELNPIYILLHTFAHILINQLSFECGYGSSALRERIYCDKGELTNDMYGVLIYTASGDSEGSLGGLVNQGIPNVIENTMRKAISNARWCTADPICIESKGQGPDSCNLAACHNCALLPETCCENGNRLLDRGMLIGTITDESIGFFKKM